MDLRIPLSKDNVSTNQQSDEELMHLLKLGDDLALSVLYERHSSKVWSYLKRRVPDSNAEDLFQDCFVKVVEKRDAWNGQPFVLWLYVVMRNTVSDYFRSKKVESKYLNFLEDRSEERESKALQVEELLGVLPNDKAQLLREFFSEGWSYKELADKYDMSEISLRKRLSRTIKKIKKEL